MYLSGDHFDGNADECYIPVFTHGRQKNSKVDVVYVGNLFTQSYYMVYDMSPLETVEQNPDNDYIQIGIGLRNWDAYATK